MAAAVLILGACLFCTETQLSYWRDSETLFTHTLAVTKNNDVAHVNLGVALEQEGKLNEALAEYREALKIAPGRYQLHNNLGNLLDLLGQPDEALAEYQEAIRLNSQEPFIHDSLGSVLVELGRLDEAMTEYTNAAQLDPTYRGRIFSWARHCSSRAATPRRSTNSAKPCGSTRKTSKSSPTSPTCSPPEENPQVRDGRTALLLAIKANTLTGGSQPFVLDVLGMACAETGDFTNATAVRAKRPRPCHRRKHKTT